MKNAIILHGCPEKENYYNTNYPSESNAHWLPWLQKELIIRDIKADTPEMPHSYEPDWASWTQEVERFDINQNTILVGHSAGAGFWLKYLSIRSELKVGRVVLVGPWCDPKNTLADETFFEFEIDENMAARTTGLTIFYAVDDSTATLKTVANLKEKLRGAIFREFPAGYGHFTYENLGTVAFPELRDEIIGV